MSKLEEGRRETPELTSHIGKHRWQENAKTSQSRGSPIHAIQRTLGNQTIQNLHKNGEADVSSSSSRSVTEFERRRETEQEIKETKLPTAEEEAPIASKRPELEPTAVVETPPKTRVGGFRGNEGRNHSPTQLQQVSSNQAAKYLAENGLQPKLKVGRADDQYEREANAIAESVVAVRPAPTASAVSGSRLGGKAAYHQIGEKALSQTVSSKQTINERPSARTIQPWNAEKNERSAQAHTEDSKARTPQIPPATADLIQYPGTGRPLPHSVRRRIEPRLGTNLSEVQVHTGPSAARAAGTLGARAFTHGNNIFLGAGESSHDLRLMAHETTHIVQQGTETVRRQPVAPPKDDRPWWKKAWEGVSDFASRLVGINAAEVARQVPGYTLFTTIAGYNPLTNRRVEFNATNLLQGLFELIPFGAKIYDALNERGLIQSAFDWVKQQVAERGLTTERVTDFLRNLLRRAIGLLPNTSAAMDLVISELGAFASDIRGFAIAIKDRVVAMIKEVAIGTAEKLLANNRAWALIKKILGYDPLRDEEVKATSTEILEDFLLLIGAEQHLEQMRKQGTVEETANWLATQIGTFKGLLGQLRGLINRTWEALRPENLPNLMNNIAALVSETGTFLKSVWEFASTVATEVLRRIKNALVGALSEYARKVPGFDLLTTILGRNPFTGEQVPRTAESLMRGFITLIPGGEAIYQQLSETGAISKAAARIEGAMEQLGITWEFVAGVFTDTWESLSIKDLADPIGTFARIVGRFGEVISRLFGFVNTVLRETFAIILDMMNFPSDLIGSIISNVMQAIDDIKTKPVGFLVNMLKAVKLGFENFFGNILNHLGRGLVDWLFRGLRAGGINPPADFSLQSVLDFVLQMLDITTERIWQRLAKHIGQENVNLIRGAVDRLTGIWTFVRDVQERGVGGIWEYIQSQITGLWDTVLGTVREWIVERVINRGIQWLMSLLDPSGIMPVINSFVAFFRAVQSAVEYARDILGIVNDYVSGIAGVARGSLEAGAQKLEQGLINAVPVAIGFLAKQFGLENIGAKIKEIVGKVRGLVDKALDWLIDKAVKAGQSILAALGITDKDQEKNVAETGKIATAPVEYGGKQHELYAEISDGELVPMIESSPTKLEIFAKSLQKKNIPIADLMKLINDLTKHGKRLGGPSKKKSKDIKLTLEKIAAFIRAHTSEALPPSQLSFGPGWEYDGSTVGEYAVAKPLSLKPGNTAGEGPTPNKLTKEVNKIYTSSPYVQMHLISARLHGPGTLANLVTAPSKYNSGPVLKIENQAQELVYSEGKVISYQHKVIWDGSRHGGNRIGQPKRPKPESYVPAGTKITIHIMKRKEGADGSNPSDWEIDKSVPPIKYEMDMTNYLP
jgi:hypothetical protein